MINYVIKRCLLAIPTLLAISMIGFVIIQLPEGDFLDRKIQELEEMYGDSSSIARIDELRERYGLDRPMWQQYVSWISGFVVGDFGESFEYEQEVNQLIWDRLAFTVLIALGALLFTYAVAIPIGIYSATHQYRLSDNVLSFISFIGMSMPGFLLALALLVFVFEIYRIPPSDSSRASTKARRGPGTSSSTS